MSAAAVAQRSDLVEVNYRKVVARALADEMELDPRVVFLGEDVGAAGGVFKTTEGLKARFGDRVRDTPIAEQAIIGAAAGAAMSGLRPVAEIMFADFAGVCFDQIVNGLAKYRYMTDGQVTVPVTVRMCGGAGAGYAAQHSQAVEHWFLGVAGLKVVVPATVEDLYGLLRTAIRDDDPVIVLEHKNLFDVKGFVPREAGEAGLVPIGVASVVTEGTDVTVVATHQMRHRAAAAAESLALDGISVEVIDPRTLVPFDLAAVAASVAKTSRLVVVEEGSADGSWGASLIARMVTEHFSLFDAPPALVCSDDTPIPYARNLEAAWLAGADKIETEVRRAVAY